VEREESGVRGPRRELRRRRLALRRIEAEGVDALAPAPGVRAHVDDVGSGRGGVLAGGIRGEDVLDKIANTPVRPGSGGEPSKPTKRVGVISIKIVPADSARGGN
jgi:hypothetical protein